MRCLLGIQEDLSSAQFNIASRIHQSSKKKTQLGFLCMESKIITKAMGIDENAIQKWEE